MKNEHLKTQKKKMFKFDIFVMHYLTKKNDWFYEHFSLLICCHVTNMNRKDLVN